MKDLEKCCACGCGHTTNKSKSGKHSRFVRGHNRRLVGSKGWIERGHRYICVNGKRRALARVIMERKLGRSLTSKEIVHHADYDSLNDDESNLVLTDRAEHMRLHRKDPWKPWPVEEERRLLEMHASGMTNGDIAAILVRPYGSVSCKLQRLRTARRL